MGPDKMKVIWYAVTLLARSEGRMGVLSGAATHGNMQVWYRNEKTCKVTFLTSDRGHVSLWPAVFSSPPTPVSHFYTFLSFSSHTQHQPVFALPADTFIILVQTCCTVLIWSRKNANRWDIGNLSTWPRAVVGSNWAARLSLKSKSSPEQLTQDFVDDPKGELCFSNTVVPNPSSLHFSPAPQSYETDII